MSPCADAFARETCGNKNPAHSTSRGEEDEETERLLCRAKEGKKTEEDGGDPEEETDAVHTRELFLQIMFQWDGEETKFLPGLW